MQQSSGLDQFPICENSEFNCWWRDFHNRRDRGRARNFHGLESIHGIWDVRQYLEWSWSGNFHLLEFKSGERDLQQLGIEYKFLFGYGRNDFGNRCDSLEFRD